MNLNQEGKAHELIRKTNKNSDMANCLRARPYHHITIRPTLHGVDEVSEVEAKFLKAQQEIVDDFRAKLLNVCESVMSVFYCDLTPYAIGDAHINFKNALRDELKESLTKEIASEYGHYSWAHSIRMSLLNQHKDVLQNKIIEDLQEKIKSLEERWDEMLKRRRW